MAVTFTELWEITGDAGFPVKTDAVKETQTEQQMSSPGGRWLWEEALMTDSGVSEASRSTLQGQRVPWK